MKKWFLLVLVLLGVSHFIHAQIQKIVLLTKTPDQYERVEWNIQLTANFVNPYWQEEVKLDMHIISPSGQTVILPCFYDSGSGGAFSYWKARFSPAEKGKYYYRFILSGGQNATDSTAENEFLAGASKSDGILHKKNNWTLEGNDASGDSLIRTGGHGRLTLQG